MNASDAAQETPQVQASDPRGSAWVSANAGSGKTTVLVRRVIRLLLDGVPPGRILCLTYTKAAAAHMANKVLEKLSGWVRLDDDALDEAIAEIEPGAPSPERRARARRMFAAALETPGGLKVQTIHAFCDRVLHMFPVEADVPAGFEVLDDLGERDMIENARLQVLLDAGRNPDSALGIALSHCIEVAGDDTIGKVIGEAVRARRNLRGFETNAARAAMLACLGLNAGDTIVSLKQRMLESGELPRSEWESAARALQELGSKNAAKIGDALLAAAQAPEAEITEAYLAVFLNAGGEPKADKTFGAAGDLARVGKIRDWLFAERVRLAELLGMLHAARECERSLALLTIASAVVARYEEVKQRRGVLDFADLVTKAVELLERERSAWVHFKLDGGIDHILVDEAQDTSPEQWRIIAKLAEEFFTGKGASGDKRRTIFAVGDEKQSIFSFQGADPARFVQMRDQFKREIGAADQSLNEPSLRKSYRSAVNVLSAIDAVFTPEHARAGLSNDTQGPFHEAVRNNAPGMVEIWPAIEAERSEDEDDGWDKPLDRPRESSAPLRLASQIAKAAYHWTHGGLTVSDRRNGEKPRAVTSGDIIILVQRRGALFDAILRALKREDVPVAGADRLTLIENIAVMDMIALGDALLLSEDDLSLACVLKSPLFGFDDEDLFKLCHERSGTLMQRLESAGNARYADAAKTIAQWRELAAHLRPFDFYSRVLGRDGGRKKMVTRLGLEAADALDEFLAAALSYESTETPSLHGFLSLLRRADAEIKRDFEAEGTSVRVMTVHGVKGLEAPVIVLADTTSLPASQNEPRLIAAGGGDDAPLLWRTNSKESSQVLLDARRDARELRLQEYRRLLYVALTRAEDVLVVCGALNKIQRNGADAGSWYDLVHSALTADAGSITKHSTLYTNGEIWRWRAAPLQKLEPKNEAAAPVPQRAPNWLAQNWEDDRTSPARLRPSRLPREISRDTSARSEGGKTRGIVLHRLLQSLPDLSPEAREDAALRYLAQAAPGLGDSAKLKLAREALAVIAHPKCAEIFGFGSRAEPELIAHIRNGARAIEIPARLDRLLVSNHSVVFADFKSDVFVPASLAEIPKHYLAQLAAYRAALGATFPGRNQKALLIFTAGPRVFEIPEESLESAWQRIKTQGSFAPA
jgi:ATP-dependent helicase/nuclease subunit A